MLAILLIVLIDGSCGRPASLYWSEIYLYYFSIFSFVIFCTAEISSILWWDCTEEFFPRYFNCHFLAIYSDVIALEAIHVVLLLKNIAVHVLWVAGLLI